MAQPAGWARVGAILLTLVAYQLAMHATHGTRYGAALALLPLAAAALWFARDSRYRLVWWAAIVLAAAASALTGGQGLRELLYGAPHALIHLALLAVFARTLLPGREALITGFARRAHGTLPPEIAAYSRRVTWAWCVYFVAMLAVSLSLFLFASRSAWSLFANVLNFPLLALMFIGEYIYRRLRYPRFSHASILKGLQLFAQHGAQVSDSARAH